MRQYLGTRIVPGSQDGPAIHELSGSKAPACEYQLDDNIPIQGRDSYHWDRRIVAFKGDILAFTGESIYPTKLTLANGVNQPAGIAPKNYFRREPNTMEYEKPYPLRDALVELPHVSTVNDANGTLVPGDFVKSNASGKPIKWDVSVDSVDQKVGMVHGIEASPFSGWLNWVQDNWGPGFPVAPMYGVVPVTAITSDGNANAAQAISTTLTTTPASSLKASLVTADSGNRVFFTTYQNLSGLHPVDVYQGGSLLAKDYSSGIYGTRIQGDAYRVDLVDGTITFDSTIATTVTVQANYRYQVGYSRGLVDDPGQQGLTDGAISGLGAGTPPLADVSGSTGILKIEFFGFGS